MLIANRSSMLVTRPLIEPWWGLKFTAQMPNSSVLFTDSSEIGQWIFSLDEGKSWTNYILGEEIPMSKVGDTVCFAAANGVVNDDVSMSAGMHFDGYGAFSVGGDIASFIKNDRATAKLIPLPTYHLCWLFNSCAALVDASALDISFTTLSEGCYDSMFMGCENLVYAPAILPANNLAIYCYSFMFSGCTALRTMPELPSLNLSDGCYNFMFETCPSLDRPVYLPATTLAMGCYYQMFSDCTKINDVTVAFDRWWNSEYASEATTQWLINVAPNGTFRCPTALGTNERITRGYTYCPDNWMVINTD